jgi:hypothetical protein
MRNESEFEILLKSMYTTGLKGMIKDYNDKCIKEGRKEDKIKGYSTYKKDELVEMLNSFFDLNEKQKIYDEKASAFTKELVENAINLVLGKFKREKISDAKKEKNPSGIVFEIKGFSWEEEAYVYLSDADYKFDRDCTCRIGSADGVCIHQMAGFLFLLSDKKIKKSDIPIDIDYPWFSDFEDSVKNLSSHLKSKDDADIEWEDDYQIFIDGDIIITQWGGPYPGKKSINATDIDESVDDWVAKKVTDKILKPIKVTKLEGYPNLPVKDNYDIIKKIMERPKLVKKILNKFKKIQSVEPDLPIEDKELEDFLKSKL